jgi:hypothetical protein
MEQWKEHVPNYLSLWNWRHTLAASGYVPAVVFTENNQIYFTQHKHEGYLPARGFPGLQN